MTWSQMTTRASIARGQGQGPFQGRVRRWVKQSVPMITASNGDSFEVPRWIATGSQ